MYRCSKCGKMQKRKPKVEVWFNLRNLTRYSYIAKFCRKCGYNCFRSLTMIEDCNTMPYNSNAPVARDLTFSRVIVPVSGTRIRLNTICFDEVDA